jgi:WD40 repeat protein
MVSLINVGYKFSQFVLERELKVHKSFVNYILNVKDQVVATASSDNLIVLLNWKQMSVVRVLKGHHDIVWNVERVDDHTLISSSTEGNIKLWNWKSGYHIRF